jgi:signal transduction histidine kinase
MNEKRWEASLTVNHPQARDWRPDEAQLMRDITARLWPAIKRARAVEALRESEEALRKSYARIEDLAGRLIAAQEEERRHVARELHDDVSQHVAALSISISRLKRQLSKADALVFEQLKQASLARVTFFRPAARRPSSRAEFLLRGVLRPGRDRHQTRH